MKTIVLLSLMICINTESIQAQAQQRKQLLLQIAALQTYIGYAKKGYDVVKKGLNFIGDVKNGELNLHSDYFISLTKINPRVKKYTKVAEIISLQFKILNVHKRTISDVKQADLFHGDEIDYIEKAFQRLIENCNSTLDELITLTTDTELEMSDDQRIERINGLHKTMMSDYSFCQNFSQQTRILSLSKAKEKNDVKQSHALYGL
jgi:hypothetical protein